MSEYYNVVPWFNSKEWLDVYENVYISKNKTEAHNLLLIWKARCPSLPSGIESTLTLLEVLIQDENNVSTMGSDQLLRLAYSSAIMRFVNHMLDTETAKGSSLYQAANRLGVPDWIIDLRHDTAHSNNLPSIELLREASHIGLDWLEKNYWLKYKECIADYQSGQKDIGTPDMNKMATFMNLCLSLSFCAHSRCKIKNLADIPDTSLVESIINDARDIFGDLIDFSNLKTVSIASLVNILNNHSKKLLKCKDAAINANKALLGEDSLFLSLDILNSLGGDIIQKRKLAPQYVQCFEVLLTCLHTYDILLDFILELIQVSNNVENGEQKCLLAALWVSEILVALEKCKRITARLKKTNLTEKESKKKLRLLYHHWFPNEKTSGLLLDVHKSVPAQLTNIEFLQPIISTYNPFLKYFIKDLLNLVEPLLPKVVTENICQLAKLISSPEKFPSASPKIYTVEDLQMADYDKHLDSIEQKEITSESNETMDVDVTHIAKTQMTAHGIWRLASGSHSWSSCPIGVLPWQQ
ncbi:uncharacterized protein LOC114356316 [Ostrinia furnacalis]|uniref:uncharacterized protein LOC114356316 n=1 Tax=Ostrinia furnacalis TaxID=93504 RepID=UPI00103A83D2|nr:uncharacterized protein LOC114356316 [Ostrinia furnacalis]